MTKISTIVDKSYIHATKLREGCHRQSRNFQSVIDDNVIVTDLIGGYISWYIERSIVCACGFCYVIFPKWYCSDKVDGIVTYIINYFRINKGVNMTSGGRTIS